MFWECIFWISHLCLCFYPVLSIPATMDLTPWFWGHVQSTNMLVMFSIRKHTPETQFLILGSEPLDSEQRIPWFISWSKTTCAAKKSRKTERTLLKSSSSFLNVAYNFLRNSNAGVCFLELSGSLLCVSWVRLLDVSSMALVSPVCFMHTCTWGGVVNRYTTPFYGLVG
jgi:hypothetical protein